LIEVKIGRIRFKPASRPQGNDFVGTRHQGSGYRSRAFPGTADLPIQMIAVYALTIDAPAKCADECDAEFARAS
jgi:hypothetical protein